MNLRHLKIAGLLFVCLLLTGFASQGAETRSANGSTDGDSGGVLWVFLNPTLIIGLGGLIYKEVSRGRREDKESKEKIVKSFEGIGSRMSSVEQLLIGYNEKGGLVDRMEQLTSSAIQDAKRRHEIQQELSYIRTAIDEIQLWMVRAGDKISFPYERRNSR